MKFANNGIRPDDILSDDQSTTTINGIEVRKGSIAAFLKNIDIIEDHFAPEQHKLDAVQIMKDLAPAVVAAGLHKHAIFRNKIVQDILDKESSK